MAMGWEPAAWTGASPSALYGLGLSGLLGSPSSSCTLNLSDYVDTSTQHTTGQRSTPSAAAGSAAQLHDAGQNILKLIVPVTTLRNMNLISDDIIFKSVIS